MSENTFFEIHRSDAVKILLSKESNPNQYTNLRLGELLESYFSQKSIGRTYIVKEDHLDLSNPLDIKTF